MSLTRAADFSYSPFGSAIPSEVGRVVHPPHTFDVGVQALRAAHLEFYRWNSKSHRDPCTIPNRNGLGSFRIVAEILKRSG